MSAPRTSSLTALVFSSLFSLTSLTLGARGAAAAGWGPWEMRIAGGGELGATSFGIFDLGLRKGPLSIQLLTDTLDLRYAPELRQGRAFVGLRAETFAAGLLISPWTDGAPDPARALYAAYLGLDGGYVRYLPAGLYAGVQGSARLYLFFAQSQTTAAVPGPTPVFTLEGVLGHYTEVSHLWLRAGLDGELTVAMPHVAVEATVRPDWALAPRVEVRGAWARNQDFITRTRLGGLNPYVVPLAGAAWAEFWVESYLALRAGPSLKVRLPSRRGAETRDHSLELAVVSDVAGFDGRTELGFGLLGRWRYGRYSLDAALGYAPWLHRQEGVWRVTGFLLFGTDWSPLRKRPTRPAPPEAPSGK
jgi:hypothetical protein